MIKDFRVTTQYDRLAMANHEIAEQTLKALCAIETKLDTLIDLLKAQKKVTPSEEYNSIDMTKSQIMPVPLAPLPSEIVEKPKRKKAKTE